MTRFANSQSCALQSWVESQPFTHAFTIMPGPQSFNEDDVRAIALDVRQYLARRLFGRRLPEDLWFVAVLECSSDQSLWHVHGCVNLTSLRVQRDFEKTGKKLMETATERHRAVGGAQAEFPNVLIERLDDSARFLSYASKQGWSDREGTRFVF